MSEPLTRHKEIIISFEYFLEIMQKNIQEKKLEYKNLFKNGLIMQKS